jgi:predicted DNA-binding ribbon-helix-helix protein
MNLKMRAADLDGNGCRQGVRLEDVTWNAVDYLCAKRKIKWHEWIKEQLAKYPDSNNMTAVLRYEVIRQTLAQLVAKDIKER